MCDINAVIKAIYQRIQVRNYFLVHVQTCKNISCSKELLIQAAKENHPVLD